MQRKKFIKYPISFILIILLSIFVFSSLTLAADVDQEIRTMVLESKTEFIDQAMAGITHLGNGAVDYTIASVLPDEEARIDAQRSILVGGASAFILKTVIGQKRPPGPIEYKHFTLDSRYHAMPSGHTTTAFALATTVARHYPKYKYLSYSLATLVGVSRLYEDMHWASNVVAGAGLGYISAKFVEIKW